MRFDDASGARLVRDGGLRLCIGVPSDWSDSDFVDPRRRDYLLPATSNHSPSGLAIFFIGVVAVRDLVRPRSPPERVGELGERFRFAFRFDRHAQIVSSALTEWVRIQIDGHPHYAC
jgi:hypothetical protein